MQARRLVLQGATVLTGPDWRPLVSHDVLIEGDRIEAVAPQGSFAYPESARKVDCKGMFLLPGFIDMHTHCHTTAAVDFLSQFGPRMEERSHREWFLKLFLAYGVTTVRDVGNFQEIFDLKREFMGNPGAPAMFVAGELMEGAELMWPLGRRVVDSRAAREEVKRQKELGADWVKLYAGLEPDVASTAIKEAHSLGLRVAGHIGKTTARQAAKMNIDTLEHTLTLVDEGFLNEEDRTSLPTATDARSRRLRLRETWAKADLDSDAAKDLVNSLLKSMTAVCPTLVVHENIMTGPDKSYQNFAYDYVPQQWLDTWEGRFKVFNPPGETLPDPHEALQKALDLIRRLRSAGVRILGGTDAALWNPYAVPGASLHREMELHVAARSSPEDALSSVTCLAADTLGVGDDVGTLEKGKLADLVLLRRNPLEDVRNTREIELVINKGHAFTPEDILEEPEPIG